MKHLKKFETVAAYNAATLDLPNVSLVEETMSIGFKPYVPETKLVCKYNVTSTSSPTVLRTNYEENVFKSMEIDGVMLDELATEHTFDTTGEHTVKYELYDETKLGNNAPVFDNGKLIECVIPGSVTSINQNAFSNCSGLTSIVIPDSVTSISYGAFSGCISLTSITIPDSVISINSGAFSGTDALKVLNYNAKCELTTYFRSNWPNLETVIIGDSTPSIGSSAISGCAGLTSVTIGNGVTSIGDSAFYGCSGLTSITIPNGITSIGINAFANCSSLANMTVDSNNTVYDSRNNCNAIIETSTNTLISGCKNTVIPDSIINIGDSAFYGCSSLASIVIPDSVTSIGINVFADCNSLTSMIVDSNNTVYDSRNNCNAIIETSSNTLIQGCKTTMIPNTVTSIGSYAFSGCSGLTSIDIPDSVTSIGNYTFKNCSGLTSCTIGSGVTSIGNGAFNYCSGLTSIDIPDSVKNIDTQAFKYCSGLASCTIGNSVTSISEYTFYGCTSLTSIDIPDSVTSIGSYAFYGCTGLTSVTIPDSVTNIGSYAFVNCSNLTSIVIPNSVTSIDDDAFQGCSGLTNIDIPDSVTNISYGVFQGCSGLTSITIPDSVTSIGRSAFDGCSNLTSIDIPDNVTSIGNNAFQGCSGLTNIDIPDSVTSIGNYTFKNCSGLTSITIGNGVTSINEGAFYGCRSLTSITIPNSVISIGSSIFVGCSDLTNVIIGSGVTSIGNYAFENCSSLTSIVSNAITAPTIQNRTFYKVKKYGTLAVPSGSSGYDVWMLAGNYYLGKYGWTMVGQYAGHNYVEIGGLKWATMNIGANSITDKGLYFQWGDTQGYTADQVGSGEGQKYFGWADYKYNSDGTDPTDTDMTKYNSNDGKTVLEASDDAVTAAWGGQWRMPTKDEYIAFGNAVNAELTTNYLESGVNGLLCTDKENSSKKLFFPACGACNAGSASNVGATVYYHASSLDPSSVKRAYRMSYTWGLMEWQNDGLRRVGLPVRGVAD